MVNVLWARASHLISDIASRRNVQSGHVFLLGLRLLLRGKSLAEPGRQRDREIERQRERQRERRGVTGGK